MTKKKRSVSNNIEHSKATEKKKRKNSTNNKKNNTISQTKRISLRKIRKPKKDDSFISDIDLIDKLTNQSSDIILNQITTLTFSISGVIVYRYTNDQIEIEGDWSNPDTGIHQPLSYLLLKKDSILFPIYRYSIDYTDYNSNFQSEKYIKNDYYLFNISSSNITEILLIPNPSLLKQILIYLTGQYTGYYMYQEKTIEDTFYLSYIYDNNNPSEQRVVGMGKNYMGEYELLGTVRFLRDKQEMIDRNSKKMKKDKGVYILGDINIRRIYHFENNNSKMSNEKKDNKKEGNNKENKEEGK